MRIDHLLRQTVSVATVASVDSAGDPTWGAPAEMVARVEGIQGRSIRGLNGEAVTADFLVWTKEPIALTSRVWLPGAATTDINAKRPVRVETVPDIGGATDFFKTYL